MIHLALVLMLGVQQTPPRPPSAQVPAAPAASKAAKPTPAAPAQDPIAEAYFQFLLGRNLESRGDVEGGIAAYRKAMELDPKSAEIPAELASLYARQSRLRDAIDAAEAALKINPAHGGAHAVLGSIYAELAEQEDASAPAKGTTGPSTLARAVAHLEAAFKAQGDQTPPGIRLGLARLYVKSKNDDKAITTLRNLLADEPYMPEAVSLLSEAYTTAGRSGEALELLKDAVVQNPDFYGALGEAYDKAQRFSDAADAYGKASAQDPSEQDLKIKWAFALMNAGGAERLKQARQQLTEVVRLNPNSGWPLYLLSQAQRESGDLDAAEQSARRLMAVAPTRAWGPHALAQVLEQRREYQKVVDALEPLAAKPADGRESDVSLMLTHLGFAYLELGRSDQAVTSFERAQTLTPDDAGLGTYLIQALLAAKQYDRALKLVQEKRQKDGKDLRLARLEADALRGTGRVEEGAALLRGQSETAGADSDGAFALAEYYAAAQRYADAARVLKGQIARTPDNLNVQFQYGAMLEKQKQFAEAEKVFRQVIAKDPKHGPTLNYLGYMMADRGDRLADALALIKRAVDADPHNGAYIDSLGWAHFKLNQLDLAEKYLKQAADQLPRDSAVQAHWGDLLSRRGRNTEAIEAWKRALAGDGESVDRAEIERKLKAAQGKVPRR
jgi:tetratricopeptide (TPR) repeat protein